MILDKIITYKVTKNKKYFLEKGYIFNNDDEIALRIEDLPLNSHYILDVKCDICNSIKRITYKQYNKSYLNNNTYCCSFKCSKEKIKINNINKYGHESASSSLEVRNKVKKTNIEKYGVENTFQNEEIKEKIKITNLEKYGVEHISQNKDIRNKIEKTNIEKYGTPYTFQNEEIKEKIKKTNVERYGFENVNNSEIIRNKIEKTNIERYGVSYTFQNEEIKEKIKKTNIERYGTINPISCSFIQNKRITTSNKKTLKKYQSLIDEERYFIEKYEKGLFTILDKKYDSFFDIKLITFYNRVIVEKTILSTIENPLGYGNISNGEKEISEFLNNYDIGYINNDKKILNGNELDIFIPSRNIAIEFNGIYWHSEIKKEEKYHQIKSLQCLEKGIQLIHVWEDDWIYKKEIIKSIILDKLGIHDTIIYARKTIIKEVSAKEAMKFLNDNHIQGNSGSNIKIGLYYNNELVSLMTFGYRYINSKKEYELLRFCNKINYKIIGGASKLFDFFKNNYDFKTIKSYSDLSISHGKLYDILGFKYEHLSKPNYYWVVNDVRKHRFNFNKKKLVKEGFESNKTEKEIMYERGYYRIFGCGQMKWIFNK